MQVSVETTSSLERKMTVGIPAAQIEDEVSKRLQDAAKKVKINGFRQGKVPLKVVKQRFGQSIRYEVIGDVINKTYFEALQEKDLRPAGQPSIDTTKDVEGEDFEYVATIEVYPEISLGDFSNIEVTKKSADISDADVDKMIDSLQKQQATWEVAERAAKLDDKVFYDFLGTKDGVEFEGGKAENQNLVLGSGSMIPGFEDGIVGMKGGEEKTISVKFPDDYNAEELKGADAEFKITVHKVFEQKLPEINAEFFKKFGVEEDDETKFREEVKKNMVRELKNAQKALVKKQVFDKLVETQEVEIPKALVASEVDNMRNQMLQQFGDQAKNLDVKSLLPDNMFEEQAQKRVALGLLVGELVKANDLKPDEAKLDQAIEDIASTYSESEDVIRYYKSNQEARASIEAMVLEDQAVEYILEKAKVSEESSNYDDIVKEHHAAQQQQM